jgi:hypothetical protein
MRPLPLLILASLCLAACGKSAGELAAEAAIEARTGQKTEIDADKGEVRIQTEQGEMKINSGAGAALPATFPKDIYLPRDYSVVAAMEMPDAVILQVLTPGEATAIAAEADTHMQAQGWKSAMTMMQGTQGKVVMYEKGKRHATLTIADDKDKGATSSPPNASERVPRHAGTQDAWKKSPIAAATPGASSMCRWWLPGMTISSPWRSNPARSRRSASGK